VGTLWGESSALLVTVVAGVMALAVGLPDAQGAERVLLRELKLKDCTLLEPVNALGPIKPNGAWKEEGDSIVATGTAAPWTIQVAGDGKWSDYRLSAKVTVRRPAPKADFPIYHAEFDRYLPREWFPPMCQHTGQYRYRYYGGEFDWGSDAAVFVRYRDREDCYRVQLSTEYQELILWHGIGGYLQVVPCELKPGRAYKLEVAARGRNIQVFLDGDRKIDYWHQTLPTLSGKIGLAAYHATVAFRDVAVAELPPPTTGAPPHRARFHTRRWRTLRWIFDGNEPCFLMERDRSPEEGGTGALFYMQVKLVPGYRPYYHAWVGVAPFVGNKTITELVGDVDSVRTTDENSDTLVLQFDSEHPQKLLRAHHTDRLTFDRVRGTYRHELTDEVEFLRDTKLATLEFCDPLTYNNKFPGRGVRYRWLPAGHKWGVVTGQDGKLYRHPISQSLNLWGQNSFLSGPGEGFWMLYPDRAACPVFQYEVSGARFLAEVCHWGYDYHQRAVWRPEPKQFKAGDRLRIRHVMTACPPREAERLFLAAPLHAHQASPRNDYTRNERYWGQNTPNSFAFPVCDPAGTDFTRLYNVREPYVGWQFVGNYTVDNTTGHDDLYSLRLDGPAQTQAYIYHHMLDGYAKRYLCTLWLKTRAVAGKGPLFVLKYPWQEGGPSDTVETGMTGDSDWQRVSFITSVPTVTPETYDASHISLSLDGPGTVWMDDFSIRPIEDGEAVSEHLPHGAKVIRVPRSEE